MPPPAGVPDRPGFEKKKQQAWLSALELPFPAERSAQRAENYETAPPGRSRRRRNGTNLHGERLHANSSRPIRIRPRKQLLCQRKMLSNGLVKTSGRVNRHPPKPANLFGKKWNTFARRTRRPVARTGNRYWAIESAARWGKAAATKERVKKNKKTGETRSRQRPARKEKTVPDTLSRGQAGITPGRPVRSITS